MTTTAVAETWHDTAALVRHTCQQFAEMHGCRHELDELEGEAKIAFMEAYLSFDRTRAQFTTWVRRYVWMRLQTVTNHATRRQRWEREVAGTEVTFADGFLNELLDGLSPDAALVARLAIQPTAEVLRSQKHRMIARLGYNRTTARLGAVHEHLRERLGWTAARIAGAFTEIREGLTT